jgi:hypothetical protein
VFVPDGDRLHRSESGGVVNQKDVSIWDDDVVGELVLRYNFCDVLRMNIIRGFRSSPNEHLVKARVRLDLGADCLKFRLR